MHKIYTRHRVRLPPISLKFIKRIGNSWKHKPPMEQKTKQKLMKILVILTIAFLTVKLILDAILPIFDKLCEDKAKAIATIVSNEQATEVMREHSYDELFTIEKDNNGNVTMIKSNVIPINEIISGVPNKIQEKIDQRGREDIQIALGSFTGIKLLAGKGPGINITIVSTGNVETDLRSEFIAQGINQTLHRVYLQVKCEVSILTPFHEIACSINNQVLLMENVIVGNVPNTYYNIEGLEGQSDALELIN